MTEIRCSAEIIVRLIGTELSSEEDLARLALETEIELNSKGMFISDFGKVGIRVHIKGYK